MMHNYRHFLWFAFLALILSACAKPQPKPLVYANWHLEKRTLQEKSVEPSYTIDAVYPEVVSYPNTASGQEFNTLVRVYIAKAIQAFKDKAPQNLQRFDDFPIEMRLNEFYISYTAHLLKARQHTLVSLRLETETQYQGEPLRVHRFAVINYDLTRGETLTLASLFKPDDKYLNVLSKACEVALQDRLTQGMTWAPWDLDASKPLAKNFRIWNLDRKGLLITFQEYQVTPYSSEPQVIVIPYYRLRSVLAENSVVTSFAYRKLEQEWAARSAKQ